MSENLAAFSIHKNFNLILFKCLWGKFGNSEVSDFLDCNFCLLTGVYWFWSGEFPKSKNLDNFNLILNWNSLRKVREIKYVSISCPFSIHKTFNLILFSFPEENLDFQRFKIFSTALFLLTGGCNWVKSQKPFFQKSSILFYFEIRWQSLKIKHVRQSWRLFQSLKFRFDSKSNFFGESLEIQRCHVFLPAVFIY